MRIYIDFDDVLCETARHLCELARDLFARQVPYEAIGDFNLQRAFDLSEDEIERLMLRAHEPCFLERLAPAPGGIEAVRALRARGHEFDIVTGRPSTSHVGSRAWLRRHGLEQVQVIHVDKYGRAPAHPPPDAPPTLSRAAFNDRHYDVAIEDAPSALDLLAHRTTCRVLVYDRPWNREYPSNPPMLRRVASWAEIVRLIGAFEPEH